MSRFFFFILILNRINGKFLSNSKSSSFIALRHIHLSTNNEQYPIRCPYNLNYLTLKLLNYSNENCFNLYSTSSNNICLHHHSPCQFHAKPVQLHCDYYSYSNHVDITYQCSHEKYAKKFYYHRTFISPVEQRNIITLHALPSNLDENIPIFLIGLGTVFILVFFICCIWFICIGQDNDKCHLLSHQSYQEESGINFNLIPNRNNFCLHVNPFETDHISTLKTI